MNTDRIEKQIVLQAPIARVWDAVSNSQAFGSWFGAEGVSYTPVNPRASAKKGVGR